MLLSVTCRKTIQTLYSNYRNVCSSLILNKNFYDVLGVSENATQTDIKNAYYNLSKKYHPDSATDEQHNEKKFLEITEAYNVLSNIKSRRLYDRGAVFTGRKAEVKDTQSDQSNDASTHSKPAADGVILKACEKSSSMDRWTIEHKNELLSEKKRIKSKLQDEKEMFDFTTETGKRYRLWRVIVVFPLLFYILYTTIAGGHFFFEDYPYEK